MAVIHHTTMSPTKLELLTSWLPTRSWYAGTSPEPVKAGGFRLDDPTDEVGIEFMVVRDAAAPGAPALLVPFTYRSAPLEGADTALIGTSEHGVLGTRWIYDGAHDPVLLGQLLAFALGRVPAQAQSVSDTLDPTVHAHWMGPTLTTGTDDKPPLPTVLSVTDSTDGTDAVIRTVPDPAEPGEPDAEASELTLHFARVLHAGTDGAPATESATPAAGSALLGVVTAGWELADGATVRGRYAEVRG
ncbi:1,4-alpha-glucan branching protein [Streptomyces sp. NA04227]|uniref:maltokinase N-terminal cap-like domain-containing protein n=1 Tax=Streptomyces sp. NA04227 TaxID=2742136 RepID=UPI00158FD2CB|nr:1,4-alpha-glucan branching protein [Streptomyces sp. NA04227]QKW07223.1 1,4-alpha-glucan branching protein [Streptomyces sp. NA04227]